MTVDGLSDVDLSYTPPFGSPWDAIQLATQSEPGRTRQAGLSLLAAPGTSRLRRGSPHVEEPP
jgi:hypothetical protein